MNIIRIHLVIGLLWLLVGMLLGEHMGRSGDHGQMPTHAHIMLLGGVVSLVWAVLYKLFDLPRDLLAWIQTLAHHAGALVMIVALYMLYGRMQTEEVLGPILGIAALAAIASVAIMLWKGLRAKV